ncbi:hypothetical protein [Phenylobacterium sp. J367]|uniref:hypothetical protein n=1 Tax=Phenylobacterium sp. J367 TaxID=2898435 RepID=UPI0021518F2D|nr:hypothetical protein [Phenylobacterium sp. J367]MCR5878464.1 hypothetical protein [Phenylobacterium sp. J367]
MNKTRMALMAGAALMLTAGAATAQPWMSINDRQANLDARIDAGVRTGDLSRQEAMSLRAEFGDLARIEARYRSNGLSAWERQDLDRRFDQLAMRIRDNRNDREVGWFGGRGWNDNNGRWVPIERRKVQLDRRIDQGLRNGKLTRQEAARLRAEFNDVVRMDMRMRRGGYSPQEMAELDRRFDQLAMRIRWEANDGQRYGYNNYRR